MAIDWTLPALLAGFALAIVVGWRFGRTGRRTMQLLVAVALIGSATSIGDQLRYRMALSSGRTQVVAGPVHDFRPAPFKGREAFTVDGVPFAYSPDLTEVGYHQAARDGGPVRPNARVRLRYVHRTPDVTDSFGNVILQVEVLR